MRPLLIILSLILGLYLLKIFVLDKEEEKPAADVVSSTIPKANKGLPVDIFVAQKENKSNTAFSTGTVVPNEEVALKSEASGRLIQLRVNEGSFVKKGQLIAKLRDDDLRAQLKKVEYEEQMAAQTKARQQKLLEINAISKEEYDIAVTKVNTLSADKEFIRAQLAKTSVYAPFSGRIGFKNVSIGAYITPNETIANLVQVDPIKIDFSLPEKYANKVKRGSSISFTIDGIDETLTAEVVAIDPKIDENLRTLSVRAKTRNSSGILLPGMFVKVNVPLGEEESIMIPTESIIPILKGKKVYVMKGGQAVAAEIETGLRTDTKIQVEKGLSEGDSVIVSALMTIKDNADVTLRNLIN